MIVLPRALRRPFERRTFESVKTFSKPLITIFFLLFSAARLSAEDSPGASTTNPEDPAAATSQTTENWSPLQEVGLRADEKIVELIPSALTPAQGDYVYYSLNRAGYIHSEAANGALQYPRVWGGAEAGYSTFLPPSQVEFEKLRLSRTQLGKPVWALDSARTLELKQIMSSWRSQYEAELKRSVPRMDLENADLGRRGSLAIFDEIHGKYGEEAFLLWRRYVNPASGKFEKRLLAITLVRYQEKNAIVTWSLASPETQLLRAAREEGSIGAVGSSLRSYTMNRIGRQLKSGALDRMTTTVLNRRSDEDYKRYGFRIDEKKLSPCSSS